eukprot:TRINITY_DN7981_c0_g1_i3.p1 TRINITY_DN7981_c0_g1~~TRINITY_DN7981_c0_g1_i3.p1  ORF type:complete len:497 (-),score=70.11 TRINITY_DN7981_c0_g1_i3:149-1639(-)
MVLTKMKMMMRMFCVVALALLVDASKARLHPSIVAQHLLVHDDRPSASPITALNSRDNQDGIIAQISSSGSYADVSTTWTVPAYPIHYAGDQILFYYTELQTNQSDLVMQVVLQFNNGLPGWSISSYYLNSNGYTGTQPAPVSPGDVITGVISRNNNNNMWSILGYVNGALKSSLNVQSSSSSSSVAVRALWTLEAYNVKQCADYPPTNILDATKYIFLDHNNRSVVPSWSHAIVNNDDCTTGANAVGATATITWNSGATVNAGYEGIDYTGGDESVTTASCALECAQKCDRDNSCVGWSYGIASKTSSSSCDPSKVGSCWLKSSIGARSNDTCRVADVKWGEAGIDRSENDLPGSPIDVGPSGSASTCGAACSEDPDCVGWVFAAESCGGHLCWLKNGYQGTSKDNCRISAVTGTSGIDYIGDDIGGGPVTLPDDATPTQCSERCTSTQGCIAWVMVNPLPGCETQNLCWLKSGLGQGGPTVNKCRRAGFAPNYP